MSHFDPKASPEEFSSQLRALKRRRAAFYLDADSGLLEPAETALQPIADALNNNRRDFGGHQAVFLELGADTGALLAAFLHRTARGQGAGGVRHWSYDSMEALLSDGLRLARGMSRKNALAGLWWGGGKGIIAQQPQADVQDVKYRARLYRDYGRFITSLRGAYITAEDVGTGADDMAEIFRTTRFVTCVPPSVGGSGNPSEATARGVVAAMEAALVFSEAGELDGESFQRRLGAGATLLEGALDGSDPGRSVLRGKRVVMQGAGNVARFMMGHLLQRGVAQVVAFEVNERAIVEARLKHIDERLILKKIEKQDLTLFAEKCDVFAPNALGGILNPETIPMLQTSIVCGAANNQLLDTQRDAALLRERGIVHVPDFVANRMGIVTCANEQYGILPNDPSILRHFDPSYGNSVQNVTRQVLARAQQEGITSVAAANELADELCHEDHPLWPQRTEQIVRSLAHDNWHLG